MARIDIPVVVRYCSDGGATIALCIEVPHRLSRVTVLRDPKSKFRDGVIFMLKASSMGKEEPLSFLIQRVVASADGISSKAPIFGIVSAVKRASIAKQASSSSSWSIMETLTLAARDMQCLSRDKELPTDLRFGM